MPFSVLPGSATRSETTSPIGGIRHRKGMVILLIGAVVAVGAIAAGPQGLMHGDDGRTLQNSALTPALLTLTTAILVILAIEYVAMRRQIRRIAEVAGVMSRMAHRQKVDSIPNLGDPDLVGDIARAIAVFRAETEEVDLRGAELDDMHARLDAALNHMPHGLLMLDSAGCVVLCNPQFRALFGHDPDIVRPGASLRQIVAHSVALGIHPGRSFEQVLEEFTARFARREQQTFEQFLPDGRRMSASWQPTADGGWVCTYEDITAREAATARMAHMARHDLRTGLPNRDALSEALKLLLSQTNTAGFNLLCVDIDRFDAVCDTRGHAVGDNLLRAVAQRLNLDLRENDGLAHLGGPSFAVLQTGNVSPEGAAMLANRLTATLSDPYDIEGRPMVISVSIGVACAQPPLEITPGELLRNAGLALHRARAAGGGAVYFFEASLDAAAQARQALELDLRAALANGQFELHYQPLVSVARRRVAGFEALIRWNHPVHGRVSPAMFIPLAEELGLISALGAWVIRTACHEAATWPLSSGQEVTVAVNLSPLQFSQPGLIETVSQALANSGLPGCRLELEITESVRLQEDATTLAVLHRLRELGCGISLDDFGTGYSSLSYLRSFPFDKIKIDQSFVRSLPAADSAAIVRAIAALGRSLNITTLAEGVETPEQLKALVAEGLQEMQGYLFSPPRPAKDVPALIAEAPTRMMAAA